MKDQSRVDALLRKFALNQCSAEEIGELVQFFQESGSSEELPPVEELLSLLEEQPQMREEASRRIFQEILQAGKEQQKLRRKKRSYSWRSFAAAMLVGVLLSGLMYREFQKPSQQLLMPAAEEITLKLEDGQIEVLENEDGYTVADRKGNKVASLVGNKLVYEKKEQAVEIRYNTLTVPNGKKFEVSLEDGTRVYLNSGTSLKFPTAFAEGEKRQVYLTGEAFFDVASDASRPFIVNAEELKIQVLGTEFNVSAYSESHTTEVVLLEGSVGMYVDGNDFSESGNKALEPGYLGSYNRENQQFTQNEVVTGIYTSWRKGELVFRNTPFREIVKKLERHYNITIINQRKELDSIAFNASFGEEPIEKVLEYFSKIYKIDYKVQDNKVIIE